MREDWTEKYRPQTLAEIVGNDSALRIIRRWCESWRNGVPRTKALVLRGEPGTGKTSAAHALARDQGWDVVEMNASDHRDAESIRRIAGMGATSQTLTPEGDFLSSSRGRRKLIILDEADNLFGREDYGGAKAIVETIRVTNQPIILIVNDYYQLSRKASAINTLADKATFYRLDRKSILTVLQRICQNENVKVDRNVLEEIANNAGGDLRAAVNDLQMLVEGREHLKAGDSSVLGKRNQEKEISCALRAMFGAQSAREARDATLDLDMTPDELIYWIEENAPDEFVSSVDLASGFDALSRADIYLKRTRTLQYYGLWSYAKELMTSGVVLAKAQRGKTSTYEYRFPGAFIVLSRANAIRASRDSVSSKLAPLLHTSTRAMSSSVLPILVGLFRNDRELLARVAVQAELDEDDIAFILGTESDSKSVDEVMARSASLKGSDGEGSRTTGKGKPVSRKKRLESF